MRILGWIGVMFTFSSCVYDASIVRIERELPDCLKQLQGFWQGGPEGADNIIVLVEEHRFTQYTGRQVRAVSQVKTCKPDQLTLRTPGGILVAKTAFQDEVLTLTPTAPAGSPPITLRRLKKVPALQELKPLPLGKAGPIEPAALAGIRKELIQRGEKDQAVRTEPIQIQDMIAVDSDNTAYLKKLVGEIGWIGFGRFGRGASVSAFLIVQHSGDLPLMMAALPEIERDFQSGQPVGPTYALLYDRLQLTLGKRQRYGTQTGKNEQGDPVVLPLEDREQVEALRKKVGLEPLSLKQPDGKDIGFSEDD